MAESPIAERRDDDPPHPNFDGIRFQATTDLKGVIAVPTTAQTMPPVSYLPLSAAVAAAAELSDYIMRLRRVDPQSYLATFLDVMLDDFMDAIEACRPPEPTP